MANTTQIKALNKKCSTLKRQLTTFKTFLGQYDAGEPDAIRLELRFNKLKALFVNVDEIYDELELIDSENEDKHADERFIMQEDYLEVTYQAETRLRRAQATVTPSNTPVSEVTNATIRKRRVKLPEASLPCFEGRYEDWLAFKDAFESMIDKQDDLSNVEKLQYLKSALKGEAAKKIKNITITEDNYHRAWDLLQKGYADKRLIISRHLSLLLRLPAQEKESAEGLRKLADETQQHLESLATLGVEITKEIIVQNLEEKLHRSTAEKWEETQKRGVFPSLDDLLEFLYKTASRLSKREEDKDENTRSKDTKNTNKFQRKKESKPARQAFVSNTGKNCVACNQTQHALYRCEKFRNLTVPKRLKIVKDASLCMNCLRAHGQEPCKFNKCLVCGVAHNTLLHDSNQPVQASTSQD